jgi:1-acyl-sn-glycerol-3-phosphate acyltransferase
MIVASNHASFVDPPLIGGVLPIRLRYLSKESLFRVPLLGFLIRTLGAVPVTREDSQRAGAVMKLLLSLLKRGESVLLFPEGSRSADGRLKPLEAGVAYLSVKSGVPVLPVYVKGSFEVWPKGKALPRPSKLKLSISGLIYPDADIPNERERREKLMKSLEKNLLAMENGADVC